jgi:hypothetical protein
MRKSFQRISKAPQVLFWVLVSVVVWSVGLGAADLYKVGVRSHDDAALLAALGVDPVYQVRDGYLVLGMVCCLEYRWTRGWSVLWRG